MFGKRLVWEEANDGLSRGFSDEGHELAQVAHVFSATGDTGGEHYSNRALFPWPVPGLTS